MSLFKELPAGPSRLARQLAALDLDEGAGLRRPGGSAPWTPSDSTTGPSAATHVDAAAVAREQATLAEFPLRPLTLPLRSRSILRRPTTQRWHTIAAAGALLAAAVAFTLTHAPWHQTTPDSDLTAKGRSSVTVYFERDGLVAALAPDERLVVGDQVRAEVASGADAVAALAVVTGDGRLLTDAASIPAGAVFVPASGARAFPASFRLVGPSEGEQLVVATCPAKDLSSGVALLTSRLQGVHDAASLRSALAPGCDMTVTTLR